MYNVLYCAVLSSGQRIAFYSNTLSAVSRIARVFPPLHEDIVPFLLQLSRVCAAERACTNTTASVDSDYALLQQLVQDTFADIVASTAVLKSEPLQEQ